MTQSDNRIYGLDVYRSIAILFVLFGHTLWHANPPDWAQLVGRFGGMGVEMFFCLSGYLIGGILIRLREQGNLVSFRDIGRFWSRRWLRTLPLYFLALTVFLRVDYMGRHGLFDYPLDWIFMQNFAWPIGNFFTLSWSLTIEEHFYLFFPLIVVTYGLMLSDKMALWASVATMFAVTLAYRLSLPVFPDSDSYAANSRGVVLAHLDGIAFGITLAAVQHWHSRIFNLLVQLAPVWALGAAIFWVWYLIGFPALDTRSVQLLLKSAEGMVCAALLASFIEMRSTPETAVARFFEVTSRWSYSLYLGHIIVIIMINRLLVDLGIFNAVEASPVIAYPLYFTAYYCLAWATYTLVEKPFMDLRNAPFTWPRLLKTSAAALTMGLGAAVFL